MTKNRTQRGGEGKTNIGMYLKLRDARDVILHRILDGEHTLVPRIAGNQRCIQRRAFAGASRPGHQYDAVRLRHPLPIECQVVGFDAERFEVKARVLRIRQ